MCAFVLLSNHLRGGFLEAVWVHGGHEVDAGIVDEVDDGLIALLVLVAKVLSQVDEQLSAHSLVAVHVGDVLKLRLTCRGKKANCCVTASQTELKDNSAACIQPSFVQHVNGLRAKG